MPMEEVPKPARREGRKALIVMPMEIPKPARREGRKALIVMPMEVPKLVRQCQKDHVSMTLMKETTKSGLWDRAQKSQIESIKK